jgi:aldehyde dehydrogenase (NAD+)
MESTGFARDLVERLRAAQARDGWPDAALRRRWLLAVARALHERRDALYAALRADLNKPEIESLFTEVRLCRDEAGFMARAVDRWMRQRRVRGNLLMFPSRAGIVPHPRGVVLVIGPWNLPVRLAVGPVLAALAAGNRVVLKPSERAPATSAALRDLFGSAVGDEVVAVAEGGRDVAEALLAQPFDLVFYTGGTAAGRAVYRAAAAQGIPAVLELGGKSPAVVHASARIGVAARRIAWGKFLNAGQTCVAPDFVCVHRSVFDEFARAVEAQVRRSFPDQATLERDCARMIGPDAFDRAEALVVGDGMKPRIVRIGTPDRARLISPPTLLLDAGWDHPAMQEEIFAPVLPVLRYEDDRALMVRLRELPSPLATYLFAEDGVAIGVYERGTHAGAFVVNDTVRHLSNLRLPFGGVGASGFGRYHGYHGFETFSHMRPVVERSSLASPFELAPPYGALAQRLLRWLG